MLSSRFHGVSQSVCKLAQTLIFTKEKAFKKHVVLCNGFLESNFLSFLQTYSEITSDSYMDYIKEYVVGIGPWKDTIVPVKDNYIQTPTDLVTRAHARNLQVN